MSTDMFDIGYENHLWHEEVKKRYDRRHLFEMQLKLDDSEGDQAIWEEIYLIDEELSALKEQDEDDGKCEDWLDEWEKCTPEFVMKKHHRTKTWEDLKIGFSHGDIYMVNCIHPNWEKEFHAENDFRRIQLIKYDPQEKKNVTTEVYEIMRYFGFNDILKDKNEHQKSKISRANQLLKVFFKLDDNPIIGKKSNKNIKVFTSKINFYYLD